MSEEDDDGVLGSLGFMFDACSSRETKVVDFDEFSITLALIGEDPGHVQSGQYLWPAAKAAGTHLMKRWQVLGSKCVIELGAGCGLAGLVVSKLSGVSHVIFTDYDRGSLEIIKSNIEANKVGESEVNATVEFFEWGIDLPPSLKNTVCESLASASDARNATMRDLLVIGTDLLYCSGVVKPLLKSVSEILSLATQSNQSCVPPMFVLVSSFDTGEDVAAEMDRCLSLFGLKSQLIHPFRFCEESSECKIEYISLL